MPNSVYTLGCSNHTGITRGFLGGAYRRITDGVLVALGALVVPGAFVVLGALVVEGALVADGAFVPLLLLKRRSV